MAMNFSSDLGKFQHHNLPELTTYPQGGTEIGNELSDCNDNLMFADSFTNPLCELDELLYSNSYTSLLTFSSSPSDNIVSFLPEIFPLEDLDSHQYPKLQKTCPNHCNSNVSPTFFDGRISNPNRVLEFLPEISAPEPKFQVPRTFNVGRTESVKKPTSRSNLSTQSIAARERRRRVTQKTQELGKLIPGGNKMHTAEMFQAASKYVKFLQAQIRILELMGSIQENNEALDTLELQTMLASPTIQEKLYSEGNCLVPREFVQTRENHCETESKSVMNEGIDQLLGANGLHGQ